jgi:Apea-like HEPN
MNQLTVEYFITFKDAGQFCKDVKTFSNLIRSNADFNLRLSKLKYKTLELRISIQGGKVENKNQNYFLVNITLPQIDKLFEFEKALKSFREIIFKADGIINTLWDDVAFHYSQQAYPIIYEIENIMRKLITKFMLRKVGVDWADETLPKDVKEAIKRKNGVDILHETDFIHLKDFLFKPYTTISVDNLYKSIKVASIIGDLNLENLKESLPKSNWDRYFKPHIEMEDGFLSKRWEKLYELRCLIAHNNIVSKADFEELEKYVKEIKAKLIKAIKNIDFIDVPYQDSLILFNQLFKELIDTSQGTDQDEIPEGQGPFGLSKDNPIPTNLIPGSNKYLDQLRTEDGKKITYRRHGSTTSSIIKKPIDLYSLFDETGNTIAQIYISPYHKKNSAKAPDGFLLISSD